MPRTALKPSADAPTAETAEARAARVESEARMMAEARTRLDAGEGITGAALAVWFDAYKATDEMIPVPKVGTAG
jgi:hypothetical protein